MALAKDKKTATVPETSKERPRVEAATTDLKNWPKTPVELLKKRYECFSTGKLDFIVESHHPESRDQIELEAIKNWSTQSIWKGLEIHEETPKGKDKFFIRFTVKYERNFETTPHTEIAEFRQHEGRWFYFDSEFPQPETVKRVAPKLGRNDPCSCGSGKKFKKCCG